MGNSNLLHHSKVSQCQLLQVVNIYSRHLNYFDFQAGCRTEAQITTFVQNLQQSLTHSTITKCSSNSQPKGMTSAPSSYPYPSPSCADLFLPTPLVPHTCLLSIRVKSHSSHILLLCMRACLVRAFLPNLFGKIDQVVHRFRHSSCPHGVGRWVNVSCRLIHQR